MINRSLISLRLLRCVPLVAMVCILGGCQHAPRATPFHYGTNNPDALNAFSRGWSQIMDEGRWMESERSFRAAVSADPNFVMGKALVARITEDLDERLRLLDDIEAHADTTDPDTRLLLDVFLMNIRAMNARDQGTSMPDGFHEQRRTTALENFSAFVQRYPDEPYMQAEYVEWVHHVHGAQAALMVMHNELPSSVASVPFFTAYQASLESERGHHDRARELAERFQEMINDPDAPQPYMVYAGLFDNLGEHEQALRYAETAVALDAKHVIARLLRNRLRDEKRDRTSDAFGVE